MGPLFPQPALLQQWTPLHPYHPYYQGPSHEQQGLFYNPLYLDSYHPNEEDPQITDIDCTPPHPPALDEMLDMSTK